MNIPTQVLAIKAEVDPVLGVARPTPNQIYKNVQVFVENRLLGPLDPDELRLEITHIGICGTDVHLSTNNPSTGYITCSAPLSIPKEGRVIGHEGVGRILEVGRNVRHFQPGMFVALESIIVCHRCPVCKRGDFNQCQNAVLLGLERDGILATVADVPASIAHDLSAYIRSEADLVAAANVEPAAVAYVGCENARIRPGEKVAVFGAGPIGLFAAMLARQVFGASEVHMIEPNVFRRDFARTWADFVYDAAESFERLPDDLDVVIEASAVLENVTEVFPKINANGRVILLGRRGHPLHIRHVDHMITNAISIMGSRGHLGGAFQQVMRLHQSERIDLTRAVTATLNGLKEARDALARPESLERQNCKVVVGLVSPTTVLSYLPEKGTAQAAYL